jgi:hypothetical protein
MYAIESRLYDVYPELTDNLVTEKLLFRRPNFARCDDTASAAKNLIASHQFPGM